MKNLKTTIASAILTAYSLMITASADLESGLSSAKTEAQSAIKTTVDTFIVPIATGIALVAFFIFIVTAVFKHRNGDDIKGSIMLAVVMLILIALLQAWSTWGWTLIGW